LAAVCFIDISQYAEKLCPMQPGRPRKNQSRGIFLVFHHLLFQIKTLVTKRRVGIILYCASNQIVLDFAAAVGVAAPDMKMRLNITIVYRALGTGQSVQASSIRELSGDTLSGAAAIQSSGFDESQCLLFKQVSFFFGL
jgi:hypothetical protein